MYKKRIHDWQLFKNQKAAEKEEIAQHLEALKKLGVDLGLPMIRGQEVKEHKIDRYVREKRKAACLPPEPPSSDQHGPAGGALTRRRDAHEGKRARVQRATSFHAISFSRIEDPTEYRNTQDLLTQIDHYFNSKLQNDPYTAWLVWRESAKLPGHGTTLQYTYQQHTYTRLFKQYGDLYQQYTSAVACLNSGRFQTGWKLMNEAADMIRPCLLKENPSFITIFLGILVDPGLGCYPEVLNLLLYLVANMATIVYGKCHPISIMCHALQVFRERKNVACLAQRKLLDTLNHHLGDDHAEPMYLRTVIGRTLEAQEAHDEAKRACREAVTVHELIRGRDDDLTRSRLYELAVLCYDCVQYSEAWEVCLDVLQRGKDQGETDRTNIKAHTMLGLISKNRKDYSTAERFLWTGLSSSLVEYGPRDPVTAELHSHYQSVVEGRQASQNALRGREPHHKVPRDTVEKLVRYLPRRCASLGSERRLNC